MQTEGKRVMLVRASKCSADGSVPGIEPMRACRFELVIFDCDGVLVDSEPLVNRAFVDVLLRDGVRLHLEDCLARFTGVSLASRVAAVGADHGWRPSESFDRDFETRLAELLRRDLRPVPGVRDVVAGLKVRRCVASNGTRAEMTARLAQVELLDLFMPHLFSAMDRAHPKPSPEVYLHAASTMGVAPASCAVVEDSIPGTQAGIAAGMHVFGYVPSGRSKELFELGANVFTSMAELPALLA
jgi:HAD superfamily hydrolase (TIGR01509 family)